MQPPPFLARGGLSRFALIGAASTLVYAAGASLLSSHRIGPGLAAVLASCVAYAFAALFSYAGHKYFTFVSDGAHSFEAPRFAMVTATGLGFSALVPAILVDGLGQPPILPILITCIAIPLANYFLLRHWVFLRGLAMPARDAR
jgi:putative flippase GtrA